MKIVLFRSLKSWESLSMMLSLTGLPSGLEVHAEIRRAQEELVREGTPSRYCLLSLLGTGSFGTVYKASDQATKTLVAYKKTERSLLHENCDQGIPVTMVREAAVLKTLNHPNVIVLKDIIVRRPVNVDLVFELCECNLRQQIHQLRTAGKTTMPTAQLQSYMRQILSAVAFVHARRILHRDLKPDNVLLCGAQRGVLKIADFGMARPFAAHRNYTERCVTSWYRPPEIILGKTNYGPGVDVWSVGAIMAEMINLCPVFQCETEIECLILIFRFLGTPTEGTWPGVTSLPHFHMAFPSWPAQSARYVLEQPVSEAAAELFCCLLQLDPARRSSAETLQTHAFLADAAAPGVGVGIIGGNGNGGGGGSSGGGNHSDANGNDHPRGSLPVDDSEAEADSEAASRSTTVPFAIIDSEDEDEEGGCGVRSLGGGSLRDVEPDGAASKPTCSALCDLASADHPSHSPGELDALFPPARRSTGTRTCAGQPGRRKHDSDSDSLAPNRPTTELECLELAGGGSGRPGLPPGLPHKSRRTASGRVTP